MIGVKEIRTEEATTTATINTQQESFSSYVSATVSTLGVSEPDADGDLPVSGDTCMAWVRVETSEP